MGILNQAKKKNRNTAVDVIRIIALLTVVSVHFFSYVGYYTMPMNGTVMLIATIIRNVFMICVPLFILLTGYLMSNKKLEKKYYKGILKTIYIFLLASIICIFYKYKKGYYNDFLEMFLSIFDYTGAGYSWYIEMYIGLFLIIPFLNLIYNNLESKKQQKVLIATLIILTSIPVITNCFHFQLNQNSSVSTGYSKLLPSYWISIYPITYYFIGCFIREHKPKMNRILNILLFVIIAIAFGAFNYYRNYNASSFEWASYQTYGALPILCMAYLVFVFLINIDFNKLPNIIKALLAKIADCCLGAYLISEIVDLYFYDKFNNIIPFGIERLKYYFIMVPLVFVCATLVSAMINFSYILVQKSVSKIISKKNAREKMSNG